MKTLILIILALAGLFLISTADLNTTQEVRATTRVIILKADDLRGTITPQFSRYIDFVQSQGIASGLGLIVSSLLDASEDDVARLKTLAAQPESFEIWLHGWGHLLKKYSPSLPFEAEFKGSGIELQTLFLKWSLEAAKLVLGIELHTFGAPGGKYDEDTIPQRRWRGFRLCGFGFTAQLMQRQGYLFCSNLQTFSSSPV
jgi:hypothetical protein